MSKIVRAVNAMIANQDKITNVLPGDNEYLFLYAGKYKWSSRAYDDKYYLVYFPGEQPLEQLARMDFNEWEHFKEYAIYSTTDIKTKEAYESFKELHQILKERVYGINQALDDIIGTDNKDDMPF